MANSSNYQIVKQDIVGSYFATPPIYVNEKFQVLFSRFATEYSNYQGENSFGLNKQNTGWLGQPSYPGAVAQV